MNLTKCPKCGNSTDLSRESCHSCGVIFSKFYKSRLAKTKGDVFNKTGRGRLRLLVDILFGILGVAMILSGFVILFVTGSANGDKALLGETSCLVFGSGIFVTGIICVLFSAYGIAREIK